MYFENSQRNSWKFDQPVSKVFDFKNELAKFVRSQSIHDDLLGFLKRLGSLIKLCRWYVPQKFSTADAVISELKSPTIRKLSYIFI